MMYNPWYTKRETKPNGDTYTVLPEKRHEPRPSQFDAFSKADRYARAATIETGHPHKIVKNYEAAPDPKNAKGELVATVRRDIMGRTWTDLESTPSRLRTEREEAHGMTVELYKDKVLTEYQARLFLKVMDAPKWQQDQLDHQPKVTR